MGANEVREDSPPREKSDSVRGEFSNEALDLMKTPENPDRGGKAERQDNDAMRQFGTPIITDNQGNNAQNKSQKDNYEKEDPMKEKYGDQTKPKDYPTIKADPYEKTEPKPQDPETTKPSELPPCLPDYVDPPMPEPLKIDELGDGDKSNESGPATGDSPDKGGAEKAPGEKEDPKAGQSKKDEEKSDSDDQSGGGTGGGDDEPEASAKSHAKKDREREKAREREREREKKLNELLKKLRESDPFLDDIMRRKMNERSGKS